MKSKRLKKRPHEDSYLTIFNRHSAPSSRRKQSWPDHLSLAAKKRLLACHAYGEIFENANKDNKQPCGRRQERFAELLRLSSACAASAASAAVRLPLHTKSGACPTSRPLSGTSVHNAEVQLRVRDIPGYSKLRVLQLRSCAVEDEPTLEDCWPSSELTLQWLRLGREKMDAFQAALRRRLSAPVEACHWPLPTCAKCTTAPLYTRGALKLSSPSAPCQFQFSRGQHRGVVDQNRGAVALRALNNKNGNSVGGGGTEGTCCCTYARNCALVVSEDPLMRPSLLAMSLGISEVHTVVMKRSNWESAATLAKCFGRPDSLKVFQSLEALEKEVFELRIAEVLTGEVTPPHTCKGAENCGFQLNGDGTGSAPGNNEKHYNHDSNTGTAEPDENAKMLQAHLHRYRIVLIDDQYCGPIASAFGLPLLLEFVRTHTCPACCLVIPRRWQTLAAPASCPPLVPSGQYLKLVEGEKADELQQRRLATSGRTMTGTSIRIEDVALSSRFCVLESFEVNSLVRCSYKDPEVKLNLGLPTKDTRGSVNALKEGGSIKEDMDSWLPTSKTLRDKCLRCAKDRHLRWSKERLTVLNGNVVCGVEVAGACAGLIVRSHILVDEGITLFPSAPLMVFLPDEVQLSTRHVVMLGPAVLPEHMQALHAPGWPSNSIPEEVRGIRSPCLSSFGICERSLHGSLVAQEKNHKKPECASPRKSGSVASLIDEMQTARPPVPPWRSLRAQQPKYRWQWTAVCDGMRQSEFDMEVTLRDLHQTTREHSVSGVLSHAKSEDV